MMPGRKNAETRMDLILWRHAEAEERAPGQSDAERRLTTRGAKQARLVAGWLRPRLPAKLRILASPAERAQATAQALDLPFETEHRIDTDANAADVLAAAGWPDRGGTVLVVGHQPTLGRVAALLLAGEEADWAIKKGGLWWFSHRVREGGTETMLKAAVAPNLL
jgi:phosphohistidine phosphatase